MGSVKDLEIVSNPTKEAMGIGRFHFSDRYSVFDWGEMPDHIKGKGAALCLMGACCFETLEEKGIRTHYKGVVDRKGKTVSVEDLREPTNVMEINLVNVYRPQVVSEDEKLRYDYSAFSPELRNFLVPLEIIYRNGLPEGSSVFKRLESGEVTIEDLGLDHYPRPGERLSKPIFDVSTKLEEKDRYVSWEEAKKIAGLTGEELEQIKDMLLSVDRLITQVALRANLENEDGKIELAFDQSRRLMVADVVGTLDESRFTCNGLQISKEIARQYYRKTKWYADVEDAKRRAEQEGTPEWKQLCRSEPPPLDPALAGVISEMYMATANAILERTFFEVPPFSEVIDKYTKTANYTID